MYGKVTQYFRKRNYGFIRGEDNNTYFIHQSMANGEYLCPGYYVYFKPFRNDRSDYNAKNLVVIETPERRRKHGNKSK